MRFSIATMATLNYSCYIINIYCDYYIISQCPKMNEPVVKTLHENFHASYFSVKYIVNGWL